MSLRSIAREQAEAIYKQALQGLFGLIERRIVWRRANAPQLALEAERMIDLIRLEKSFVAFRQWKIAYWKARYRKHAARAWAMNRGLAMACRICPPEGGSYA